MNGVIIVFILSMFPSVFGLNTFILLHSHSNKEFMGIGSRTSLCMVSKHLVANAIKSGQILKENEVIDPKKQEMLIRLGLDDDNIVLVNHNGKYVKTGAELRKDRKAELRIKAKNVKQTDRIKPSNDKKSERSRFKLGNGMEALTPESLVGLVRSTAPYYYPETSERMVMDDNEDEDNDDEHYVTHLPADGKGPDASSCPTHDRMRLSTLASGPTGWRNVLTASTAYLKPSADKPSEDDRVDYFALCLASHFSTVATYVPTDVDSKIRGHCWNDPSIEVLHKQLDVFKHALSWNVHEVSKKSLLLPSDDAEGSSDDAEGSSDGEVVSGHNGEWLGVMCGALGGFLRAGDLKYADELEDMILTELEREARIFKRYRHMKSSPETDTTLLKIAAIVTHNVGDVDQGLSYWEGVEKKYPDRHQRFNRLAHERSERFGGEFMRAKAIYKELLSAEGHRNYPLREAKCLRRSPEFMLPLGPWYERWGRLIAMHPGLDDDERYQVIRQLIRGCDSTSKGWCVPNQVGYYRALQGIASCISLERLNLHLDKQCRSALKEHDARFHLSLSEDAFASRLGRRARDILETL